MDIVTQNGGGPDAIQLVLQQAKEKAFHEISSHSPNRIPTKTAEVYQEVCNDLDIQIHSSIKKVEGGTCRICVSRHGKTRIVRSHFRSESDAIEWRDSDFGSAMIKSILSEMR